MPALNQCPIFKPWAQNPIQRQPSDSIHDQDLCLMEAVSGLVAELQGFINVHGSMGQLELQSMGFWPPNMFGYFWRACRFQLDQLASKKDPVVPPCWHSRVGSSRQQFYHQYAVYHYHPIEMAYCSSPFRSQKIFPKVSFPHAPESAGPEIIWPTL